jgi:hypothetical protein
VTWLRQRRNWGADRRRADSLSEIGRQTALVLFGASNIGGSDTGQFGTNVLTKPAAVTLIRNGVTLSDYSAVHGPEVGIVAELQDQGRLPAALTILSRSVAGTALSTWVSTHCATTIADCVTAGIVPKVACSIAPNADVATVALGHGLRHSVPLVERTFGAAWGRCGFLWGCPSNASALGHAEGDAAVRALAADRTGLRAKVETDDLEVQTDALHFTSAGQVALGRRMAQKLIASGVL